MSLKSLLQTLCAQFYTKNDSAEVAALSAPSASHVEVSLPSSGTTTTVVSPLNGFLNVYSATQGGSSFRELKAYPQPENTGVYSGINLENTAGGYIFIPVRKGETIQIWGTGLDLSKCTAKFVAFVGGGLRLIYELLFGKFCGEVCHA